MIKESKVVLVCFSGSHKEYAYHTDEAFKRGDLAIVEVSGEYRVVKVVKVEGLSIAHLQKANRWVVQKVDVDSYISKQVVREKMSELKNQLRKRKEEMEEFLIFKTLADSDPVAKGLISELVDLDPSFKLLVENKPQTSVDK